VDGDEAPSRQTASSSCAEAATAVAGNPRRRLARQKAISLRTTVSAYLRRTLTRVEITAARRAAHGLAASGQAETLRVKPPKCGEGGSAHLILARPGATTGWRSR